MGDNIILDLYNRIKQLDSNADLIVNRYIFTLFLEKYNLLESGDVRNCQDLMEVFKKAKNIAPTLKLFKKDLNINNDEIIDELLKIRKFNFDLDIFAHIYEKNLNQTKVKMKGVFYTPDYITDYILNTTIISYLSPTAKTVEELISETPPDTLKDKIKNLKILDPACGSGVFLIKTIDILYKIIKAIDLDIDLSNNIYGVDIDCRAVEITKLTLFLKFKSLGIDFDSCNLNKNIICANSLIDFKTSLKFDIIVGNPPYVNIYKISSNKDELTYYQNNYFSAYKKFDLYVLFLEKSLKLLKNNGILGFIIPNNFTSQPYGFKIRQLLLTQYNIKKIINLSKFNIFRQNTNLIILFVENSFDESNVISIDEPLKIPINSGEFISNEINQIIFKNSNDYSIRLNLTNNDLSILSKIREKSIMLSDVCFVGVGTRSIPQSKHHFKKKLESNARKLIVGRDVLKNYINYNGLWLNYIDKLYNPMFPELFDNEKIIIRDFMSDNKMVIAYDVDNYYTSHTTLCCLLKSQLPDKVTESEVEFSKNFNLKYIFALLTSNVCEYYFKKMYSNGLHVYVNDLRRLPVINIDKDLQEYFVLIVGDILKLSKDLHTEINRFHDYLKLDKLSRKLKGYYKLSYDEFSDELKLKGVFSDCEIKKEFIKSKCFVNDLIFKINGLEDDINREVYNLYAFEKNEISQIENFLSLN